MPNFAGPIVDQSLATFGGSFAGPLVEASLAIIPAKLAGPTTESNLAAIPAKSAGPLVELTLEVVIPVFTGPTGGTQALLAPTQTFSVPTGGNAVIAAAQNYGVPTGERARVAIRSFSGTTSGVSPITPPRSYGPPTSGTVSSLLPARGFSTSTGGIYQGIPAPINLTATVLDAGCVQLAWTDPGPEEEGYRIERSVSGADDWSVIGYVAANVTSFLDRFAVPLTLYDYRVIGFDSVKESSPSNIAMAVTPLPPDIDVGPPPVAPANPVRNRIEPDLLEFKSPGAYGLEKDDNGNVTGFKY